MGKRNPYFNNKYIEPEEINIVCLKLGIQEDHKNRPFLNLFEKSGVFFMLEWSEWAPKTH